MPNIAESEYFFTSSEGKTPIHVRVWEPDCDLNGVVQLAHGINEYIGRYEPFARQLASKGFAVVGSDHLGHGQSVLSEDRLGYFADSDGWYHVVDDVEELRRRTHEKYPELPYFVFGHSMGSFVVRTWLIRHPQSRVDGVILCGTGQPPAPIVAGGRLACDADMLKNGPMHRSEAIYNLAFGAYNKRIEPLRTQYDWLTRDEAVVDKYAADPLCTFIPTSSLMRDMMFGLGIIGSASALRRMRQDVPVLFISGEADPVGGYGMQVARVYASFVKAGLADVAYKFYPEARHELLNEINRGEVYQDILDWLFKKLD